MGHKVNVFRNIKDLHFEVTKVCNMNCIYCSAYKVQTRPNQFMPRKTAHKFIDLVFESTCAKDIGLLFYGGEALLQSATWFYDVIEYANKQATKNDQKLHFLMQSNLTLLDDEKLDLMRKYQIVTGTSLDGPPSISDITRGKSDLVLNNILKLKEAGCFGGVICTINEYNYNKITNILEFFEAQKIFWVAFNIMYCIGRGRNLVPLSADKVFLAYKQIYDYLENTRGTKIIEGNMAERLVKYVYPHGLAEYKEMLMCNHPFCGGGITLVLCDTEGDLYPCGCSNMTTEFRLANVNGLNEETYMNAIRKFHAKSKKYYDECCSCDAARICNFSCTGFRAIDNLTAESECNATKMLYSYLRNKGDKVISEIVQNMRNGRQEYDWRIKRLEAQMSLLHKV